MPFSVLRLIKRPGDRPIPEPSGRLLPGSLSHKTHQSVQGGKFRNSPPRVERADSFLRYAPWKKRIHLFGIWHVFFKIVSAEFVNAARLHLQKSCFNVSLPLAPQGRERRPPSTVPTGLSDRQMSETHSGQSEPDIWLKQLRSKWQHHLTENRPLSEKK